jgi:hypothetical protein
MSDSTFSCPSCSQRIACDGSGCGQNIMCPACQTAVVVPDLNRSVPPPIPQSARAFSASGASGLAQMKIPMGVASLVLVVLGRIVFPLLGQALGGLFFLLAFVCTFGGFVLAIVSLFKKDGWEFGIIAIFLTVFLSLLLGH